MLLKRSKLSTVILIIVIIFLVTTSYLLLILTDQEDRDESKVKHDHHHEYHKLIYQELTKLSKRYTDKNVDINDQLVDRFIDNINNQPESVNLTKLWAIVNKEWITRTGVVDLESPYLHQLYHAMRNSKIIKADIDRRGTQLKLLLTLEGNQQVIFKPKWYNITKIIKGPIYAGKDRYNGEILAFYLSVLLHKPLTPFCIQRSISLINEIQPVGSQLLLNTSYLNNKRMCIYGKCYYCTRNDPICDDYDDTLNGALIFNIKANLKTYRSPWQRTYKNNQLALWQQRDYNDNQNYCKTISRKLNRQRLLDLIDVSIFDFLTQNGDRHHYETFSDSILWLDNGKSFGNPFQQHLDILAPLYQCCMLRTTMLENLERLRCGNLRRRLLSMPDIKKLITDEHLNALEERLLIVFATIQFCKKHQKPK